MTFEFDKRKILENVNGIDMKKHIEELINSKNRVLENFCEMWLISREDAESIIHNFDDIMLVKNFRDDGSISFHLEMKH